MSKIRCLLVDDEPPAIELLKNYAGMIEQLEVIGTSHSAVQAFDLLKDQPIDLLFLDIRMPVLNGIDFIKALSNPPAIILTTAYREYALDGYDLDIIDYLLKPITFARFLKAVDRYRNRLVSPNPAKPTSTAPKAPEHIFFNINRTQHKVILSDILYLESLKDYVRIHTKEDRLVVKGNLGSLMKEVPADRFLRIHRSFSIALAHVKSYNRSEVEIGGRKLPIGLSYREDLLARLKW